MSGYPPTSGEKNGCVCIFSNQLRVAQELHRKYAELMRNLWVDILGCELFEGRVYYDNKVHEIAETLQRLSTWSSASSFKYLVLVIIAEGGLVEPRRKPFSPHILGSDGEMISEKRITDFLGNSNKSPWRGKPKLFIAGYSRLHKMDLSPTADRTFSSEDSETQKPSFNEIDRLGYTIDPTKSDVLLLYGEPPLRLIEKVHTICSKNGLLTKLLAEVNHQMSAISGFCAYESSVTTKLLLRDLSESEEKMRSLNDLLQEISDPDRLNGSRVHAIQKQVQLIQRITGKGNGLRQVYQEIKDRKPLKGCALLISNKIEADPSAHKEDNAMMKKLWKDTLNCDLVGGKPHEELTANQIKEQFRKLSEMDSESYDYLVVVISSHGDSLPEAIDSTLVYRSKIIGTCDGEVDEYDILSEFSKPTSKWYGKVKLFFLDYCRGGKEDHGVPTKVTVEETGIDQRILPPYITPVTKDSFVMYSTHYNQVAMTNRLTLAVSEVFTNNWKVESVSAMLTMVNAKMKRYQTWGIKTMSIFKSTVTTDFHLYKH